MIETVKQYHRSGRSLDSLDKTLYDFSVASGFTVRIYSHYVSPSQYRVNMPLNALYIWPTPSSINIQNLCHKNIHRPTRCFFVTNSWVILKLLKEHNASGLILRRKMHVIHQN